MQPCAISLKDQRIIPNTSEIETNPNYYGISTRLAVLAEQGLVKKDSVLRYILNDKSPEELVKDFGQTVQSPPETPIIDDGDDNVARASLEDMTLAELKDFAKKSGVKFGARDPKDKIVDLVLEALAQDIDGVPGGEQDSAPVGDPFESEVGETQPNVEG